MEKCIVRHEIKKMRLTAASFAYDISWSCLDFVVNSGDIVSYNAQADHKSTADNQLQKDYSGKSFLCCAGKISVKGLNAKNNGCAEHDPAQQSNQLHGSTGEGGNVLDGVFGKAPDGPFGGADGALLYFKRKGGSFKTYPGR